MKLISQQTDKSEALLTMLKDKAQGLTSEEETAVQSVFKALTESLAHSSSQIKTAS